MNPKLPARLSERTRQPEECSLAHPRGVGVGPGNPDDEWLSYTPEELAAQQRSILLAYESYTALGDRLRAEAIQAARGRAIAVAMLSEYGWGYRTIAEKLGITHPRVQQLVRVGKRALAEMERESFASAKLSHSSIPY